MLADGPNKKKKYVKYIFPVILDSSYHADVCSSVFLISLILISFLML